jgi:hypothetical protein
VRGARHQNKSRQLAFLWYGTICITEGSFLGFPPKQNTELYTAKHVHIFIYARVHYKYVYIYMYMSTFTYMCTYCLAVLLNPYGEIGSRYTSMSMMVIGLAV